MWLLKNTPALFTDLYELTMAQVYFQKNINRIAHFEVFIRTPPKNWGFFAMAGLAELKSYLDVFQFNDEDIEYLKSIQNFSAEFLDFLKTLKPDVNIRALEEGTVFFPGEPVLEITGPLIDTQILESYVLNILGFSIIQATLAARFSIAAAGIPLVDFGLRRAQGPIASLRVARAAQSADFIATSNVFAARLLDFPLAGTMAHSFVQAAESETQAFRDFANYYGSDAILLVDTYDTTEGIKKAASVARETHQQKGIKIKGIRIDSGDFVKSSKFARKYFNRCNLDFLKIFLSGNLDEYKITKLLKTGVQADGFGVGTNLAVSQYAPSADIVYKLVCYNRKNVFKTSPKKQTLPGRKSIIRIKEKYYKKDVVSPLRRADDDLLKPFAEPDDINTIKNRLTSELSNLPPAVKKIENPSRYPVEFDF